MLRFDEIVFGPIRSRRLGSSLGINLLPADGKLCNFDCIYCECGWNRDGISQDRIIPSVADFESALEDKLKKCASEGVRIDSITFSGNGEPTLHPDFPEIIDKTIALRNAFYPQAKVSVLSNATMVGSRNVLEALAKVDNPILKIDASDNEGIALINRPSGNYDLQRIISGLRSLEGNFVLQTMFLSSPSFDTAKPKNLEGWMNIVRELRPREIMVYTIDRETPEKDLKKYSVEQMERMVEPLVREGFKIQIRG